MKTSFSTEPRGLNDETRSLLIEIANCQDKNISIVFAYHRPDNAKDDRSKSIIAGDVLMQMQMVDRLRENVATAAMESLKSIGVDILEEARKTKSSCICGQCKSSDEEPAANG